MNDNTFTKHVSIAAIMLLQFLLLAVWWVPLAAYLTNRGIDGSMKALILSSMAIGSMVSPIIGAFADRYLSAQKILAISNLLTALFLLVAGLSDNILWIFVSIFAAMLCYMPTWSLTSAIAMTHAKPELFPRIRMFGSIGWIASGLFSLVAVKIFGVKMFDGTNIPLFCGSAVAVLAALVSLTLPDTPPNRGEGKISVRKLLGLDAFLLLRDRNYRIFIACSAAAMLAFALYYSFGSEFLQDRQFTYITVTMNWGQVVELFFLFFATTIITKAGIKNALAVGIIALIARYLAFYMGGVFDVKAYYIAGILFHGLIFGLLFVGGQVYTNSKAPENLRAQAQGMLSFLIWGVALLLGNFVCGQLISLNKTVDAASGTAVYDWNTIFAVTTGFSVAVAILFYVFFKQEKDKLS
ncbi:MAG: MFS transporter [Prevotellaceae bacterium]|jgi:nucleoside transporter|nr:MFS transporter [Prevotellaceae bacterium]